MSAHVLVTDRSTRHEIEEALTWLAHRATREIPKVGTAEYPTQWDRRHLAINVLLDDLERAKA